MAKYIVCQTLTSRQHNRTFEVGEEIEFNPNPVPIEGEELSPDAVIVDIDGLLAMGAIMPVAEEQETE